MLIQFLTYTLSGYATGSTFNDQELKNSYFPGEGIMDGKVIAIKTHTHSDTVGPFHNHHLGKPSA